MDVQASDGSATLANNDYQPGLVTVNFPPGTISQPAAVLVNGDVTQEDDEDFDVQLVNFNSCQPGAVLGFGTIQNDDATPLVAIADASVAEGDAGLVAINFLVTLSNPTEQPVQVEYQTNDGSATTADLDYVPQVGNITIPPKTPDGLITVFVQGDTCGESDEDFAVLITSVTGAVAGDPLGIATILNDDDAVTPVVQVLSPNGGEVLEEGTNVPLTWNASDDVAVTGVDILLSRDNGATYPEVLASNIPNSGSFLWTVTGPVSPVFEAFIKVVARDGGCNAAEDVSDAAFRIASPVSAVSLAGRIEEFALGNLHPNPTSGATRIEFQLPSAASVKLSVVDVQGRIVAPLIDRAFPAGRFEATWTGQTDNGPASHGVYFIHFEAGGRSFTRRLVMSR